MFAQNQVFPTVSIQIGKGGCSTAPQIFRQHLLANIPELAIRAALIEESALDIDHQHVEIAITIEITQVNAAMNKIKCAGNPAVGEPAHIDATVARYLAKEPMFRPSYLL